MAKKKKSNLLMKVFKAYTMISTVYTMYMFLKARGTAKEDDRHLIGKAIDRFVGLKVEADKVITIDDTEMSILYNPYLQLLTGSLGGVAVVLNGTTEVVIDDNYRNMSEKTQYAILCHELGHYKLGHKPGATYWRDRRKALKNNEVLPMELEADLYAANIIGPYNMINALQELGTIKGISKKELRLRIKYIKLSIRCRKAQYDVDGNIIGYNVYDGFDRLVGYINEAGYVGR